MNRKILIVAAAFATVVVSLGVQAAMADFITLASPSFESPVLVPNQNGDQEDETIPAGWTRGGTGYLAITLGEASAFGALPAGNGTQYEQLGGTAYLWQNTGVALTPGMQYNLSFWTSCGSSQPDGWFGALKAASSASSEGTDFASQTFSVTAGATWQQQTLSAVYNGSGNEYLTVAIGGTSVSHSWEAFDAVSLTVTQAPEPSTLVIFSVGLVSLLAYAWRKRK